MQPQISDVVPRIVYEFHGPFLPFSIVFHNHRDDEPAPLLDGVSLHLFGAVASSQPLTSKRKIAAKPRSPKLGGEPLAFTHGGDDLFFSGPAFLQALDRVRVYAACAADNRPALVNWSRITCRGLAGSRLQNPQLVCATASLARRQNWRHHSCRRYLCTSPPAGTDTGAASSSRLSHGWSRPRTWWR